jgi:osmotically-inducible protein OsmY
MLCTTARRAAFLLACAAAGCGRTDGQLRSEVQARIALDPASAPLAVSVAVDSGVVHLSGATTSREQQARVRALARGVAGVRDVVSEFTIDDPVVAEAVQKALAADALLSNIPITADVVNGIVKLYSDQTGAEHRKRAIEIAGAIDGVTRVEDWMR